jgi:hypothetical protein
MAHRPKRIADNGNINFSFVIFAIENDNFRFNVMIILMTTVQFIKKEMKRNLIRDFTARYRPAIPSFVCLFVAQKIFSASFSFGHQIWSKCL